MADYKRLDVNEVGDVTVVRFKDKKIVEDINIEELGRELFQLVEQDNRKKLLLNFSSVDFLSSSALGKLITLEKKVRANGGVLKLNGGTKPVATVGSTVQIIVPPGVIITTSQGPGTILAGSIFQGIVQTGNPTILV